MSPTYDVKDQLDRNWEAHNKRCRIIAAGKEPFEGPWHPRTGYGKCCSKADTVHGTCVCAYRLCCPDHGHQCVGSHD